MALLELDVHMWRALALLLPDPTAFASCCKRASQVTSGDEFRLSWFLAHHRCAWSTWQWHMQQQPLPISRGCNPYPAAVL
jgi:hypothetical protein